MLKPSARAPGSPPPPILGTPAGGATITAPVDVTFSWRDGDGLPRATSFRLCIAEVGIGCGDSGSVMRPIPGGEPLTATTLAIRFDPTDSLFGLGTLQGKRLTWSVAACATNTLAPMVSGVRPAACTYAPLRTLEYPLPAPVLTFPPTGYRFVDSRYPALRWEYVKGVNDALHLAGVEHWLVCIARPGMVCPTTSIASPDIFVTQVAVERLYNAGPIRFPYTKEQRYSATASAPTSLTGHGQFAWTVAACNAAYGCRYQPVMRNFELPPAR